MCGGLPESIKGTDEQAVRLGLPYPGIFAPHLREFGTPHDTPKPLEF